MGFLSESDVARLELQAFALRKTVIEMLVEAKSGHTAGPLGLADIFSSLYFYLLNHNPSDPEWVDRDRLILSNGHVAPIRYASMALSGYFPVEELRTLRQFGSRLQGHPERTHLPGVETTSGPLGEGLGQAIGIALGARMDEKAFHTYCIMSDGEQQCGSVWEAVMFAGKEQLTNLTAIIDRNGIQITGPTEKVMPIEPIVEKYESFGWRAVIVDGNDVAMFCEAVQSAKEEESPVVIIAHTVPGKGVPSIEGKCEWHGKVPSEEEAHTWLSELQAQYKSRT